MAVRGGRRVTVSQLAEQMEREFKALHKRQDRFEEQVLRALAERPTLEHVQAVANAAALQAASQVLAAGRRNGNGHTNGQGNGLRGPVWWEAWGRAVATIAGVLGVIGSGLAYLVAILRGEGGS